MLKTEPANINTDAKVEDDGKARMPHERDQSPDGHQPAERSIMKQAAADVESGMVDTDLRNQPGVEHIENPTPRNATAKPLPDTKQD